MSVFTPAAAGEDFAVAARLPGTKAMEPVSTKLYEFLMRPIPAGPATGAAMSVPADALMTPRPGSPSPRSPRPAGHRP